MELLIENMKIGLRLLSESIFYFLFSYITIFISIFTMKVVSGDGYTSVFHTPEILLSFLATIPTYLIGIHYVAEDNKKNLKNILLIFIVLSIALFGIVFNVKTIKDMDTIKNLTYLMLFGSFLLTMVTKFDFEEFKIDVKTQKKANKSRTKKEKTFANGKKVSF